MVSWNQTPRFKILTINLPFEFIDLIEQMKKANLVPSRSEYIRMAIWEKLSRDLEFMKVTLRADMKMPDVYESPTAFCIDGKVWQKQ